jgi:hypothetical protein
MLMQIITMGEDFAFVHFIFIQKKSPQAKENL